MRVTAPDGGRPSRPGHPLVDTAPARPGGHTHHHRPVSPPARACLRLTSLILTDTTGEPVSVFVRRLVVALGCSRHTARRVRRLVEAATSENPYGWEWTDPGRTGADWTVLPAA